MTSSLLCYAYVTWLCDLACVVHVPRVCNPCRSRSVVLPTRKALVTKQKRRCSLCVQQGRPGILVGARETGKNVVAKWFDPYRAARNVFPECIAQNVSWTPLSPSLSSTSSPPSSPSSSAATAVSSSPSSSATASMPSASVPTAVDVSTGGDLHFQLKISNHADCIVAVQLTHDSDSGGGGVVVDGLPVTFSVAAYDEMSEYDPDANLPCDSSLVAVKHNTAVVSVVAHVPATAPTRRADAAHSMDTAGGDRGFGSGSVSDPCVRLGVKLTYASTYFSQLVGAPVPAAAAAGHSLSSSVQFSVASLVAPSKDAGVLSGLLFLPK